MGGQIGGSGNFNMFSMNTVIPYEGMINENYFPIRERETNLAASLELFKSTTKRVKFACAPFNKHDLILPFYFIIIFLFFNPISSPINSNAHFLSNHG